MQIFDGRLWIWLLRFLIVISIPLFLLLIIWGWFSSKDKLDKDVNQRDEGIETEKKFVIQNVSSQKTPKQNQGTQERDPILW